MADNTFIVPATPGAPQFCLNFCPAIATMSVMSQESYKSAKRVFRVVRPNGVDFQPDHLTTARVCASAVIPVPALRKTGNLPDVGMCPKR